MRMHRYHQTGLRSRALALESSPQLFLRVAHLDWLRLTLADLRSGRRWGADKALRRWVSEHRLSGAGAGAQDASAHGPEADRIRERLREARPKAEATLARMVAELG